MADSVNVRIEDDEGNKYYVQTTAENVLLKDGSTLEQKLEEIPREIIDSVAIISSSSGEEIEITDSAEAPLMGLNLYATCKQNTVPGNQLFNSAKMKSGMLDRWTGNISSIAGFVTSDFIPVKPNTQYCLSKVLNPNGKFFDDKKQIFDTDWNIQRDSTFTTTENTAYVRFSFASVASSASEIMMNEGKDPLPYERYVGGIPSPNGDYPQEIQTISNFTLEVNDGANAKQELSIVIPEQGFYGIPVESGGNYTDTSGQQWICDEFDFTSKKFIKRIGKKIWDGGGWWLEERSNGKIRFKIPIEDAKMDSTVCICNRAINAEVRATWDNKEYECSLSGAYFYVYKQFENTAELKEWMTTHPFEVLYPLATPVEYDLTDEEVQAFMALHAYKPTTYITNDAELPVGMETSYVADLQAYIDNKIAALSSSGEGE